MASIVSIANRALTKLGEDRILLLTDDTKPARTMNSMFADVRDAELRRHRWKFAIKRGSLLALTEVPEWGYLYQYPLPADFLGLVQVGERYVRASDKSVAPWSVEGRRILTSLAAPLRIRYTARIEDPTLYDPLFVEVLACKLAYEAAETLTQSGAKLEAAGKAYTFALSEAVRQDAIENPPDELPQGSWLDARGADGESYKYSIENGWTAYPSGVA